MRAAALPKGSYTDRPNCQQLETLYKTLIVGGIPVELHLAGLWLSHEDRQRQRSTNGKLDL